MKIVRLFANRNQNESVVTNDWLLDLNILHVTVKFVCYMQAEKHMKCACNFHLVQCCHNNLSVDALPTIQLL